MSKEPMTAAAATTEPGWPAARFISAGDRRRRRGLRAAEAGRSAENAALRRYEARGWRLIARNWRAPREMGGGELDLVLWGGRELAVVEVKARRSLAEAAQAVRPAQRVRIQHAALAFAEARGVAGCDLRFDLALLDRDGRLEVLENAFMD